jgi:hypothetical protein
MDEHTEAWLDFAVGGRPSRFMQSDADWERFYRFVKHVAALDPADRPTHEEVRARLELWLPRRPGWVEELLAAYRHGLAILDHGDDD